MPQWVCCAHHFREKVNKSIKDQQTNNKYLQKEATLGIPDGMLEDLTNKWSSTELAFSQRNIYPSSDRTILHCDLWTWTHIRLLISTWL